MVLKLSNYNIVENIDSIQEAGLAGLIDIVCGKGASRYFIPDNMPWSKIHKDTDYNINKKEIGPVVEKLEKIGESFGIDFILSISLDETELPDDLCLEVKYIKTQITI